MSKAGECQCAKSQIRCTCGKGHCKDFKNDSCVAMPESASRISKPIRTRLMKQAQSRYSGYSPPPYTIAGGTPYGSMPTFVYNCDSNSLGERLEESNWWIFGGGECRNACAGHEKRSDAWHECMDVCKEKDTSENGGGGFGDWLGDIFKKPSESGCKEECPCEDNESWLKCDECIEDCENLRSQAGAFVEKEGGLLGLFDKLGGFIAKTKGWGKGDSGLSDDEWKLRAEEDKNKRLVWGIAIFVFIIVIIGFVVFMGRKKK